MMRRRCIIFIKLLINVLIGIKLLSPIEVWGTFTVEQKMDVPLSTKASLVGLSEDDFMLFSQVVEAESDRSDNLEAKVLIAETIWNRTNSPNWPNTVHKCITQSGQFQVYYEGTYKSIGNTDIAEVAVVEAYYRIYKEEAPNVIYFNCLGYNNLGTPYCYEGGNYFETEP